MTEPILEIDQLTKCFFGVPVLSDIQLRLHAGQSIGLIGENGAGKSTLLNLIGGLLQPDGGQMRLFGQTYAPQSAADATALGIALVHQELNLFPNLNVAENIFLTDFPSAGWGAWIRKRQLFEQTTQVLRRVGLEVSPQELLERLSPGQRQLVEVAKAIRQNARVLLLDEPTTSLTAPESERLFAILRDLRHRGMSVVYISHNLNDVRALCDSIVVLRDGQIQANGPAESFDLDQLISLMVGRRIHQLYPERQSACTERPVLEVRELSQPGVVRDISFQLFQGEVLGISGLMGAGRTELARMLFGLDPYQSGTISVYGKRIRPTPQRCIRAGMAFVTESRREDGLLLDASILDNSVLASLRRFTRPVIPWFQQLRARAAVQQATSDLQLRYHSATQQPVITLSGGNQQKVVVAKWMLTEPRIVILDEPTRGIDVGAKVELYRLINRLAEQGTGLLIISSELEELVGLCDRILVMANGQLRSEVRRDQFDRETLLREAFGKERLT